METIYFTATAILLYVAANWVLERIEIRAGKRLEHRSILFFAILLGFALTTFALIRHYTGNP